MKINKDTCLILASRGLRTFPYGYLSVTIPIYLASIGSAFLVGWFFFLSMTSSVVVLFFLSTLGHKFRIRCVLVLQILLMGIGMLILSSSTFPLLILLAASVSVTSWAPGGGSGAGSGAYNTTLNLLLSQKIDKNSRTFVFSLSSVTGTLSFAAGAYFLVIAKSFKLAYSLSAIGINLNFNNPTALFILASIMQFVAILLIIPVSKEIPINGGNGLIPKSLSERQNLRDPRLLNVVRDALKFIVAELLNGFGNGLFLSLIPLWFFLRFQIAPAAIGEILAIGGIITALMILLSHRLESKLGSVRSISFTRVVYAISMVGMALSPTLEVALAIYYLSMVISRISTPIQQSFVYARIPAQDWARANGMIAVGNSIGGSIGPLIGAYLLLDFNQTSPFVLALPFIIASGIMYKGFAQKGDSGEVPRQ